MQAGLFFVLVGGAFLVSMVWTMFLVYEGGKLLLLAVY
jgi:hypothetical protein